MVQALPVVLDTSFLIDVSRHDPGADAVLEDLERSGTHAIIPTVVVAEYLTGSRRPRIDLETLRSSGEIVDFTLDDAYLASELARRLLAEGRFPGWNDVLIGGLALNRGGLEVVTRNPDHFLGLKTRTYASPPASPPPARRHRRRGRAGESARTPRG